MKKIGLFGGALIAAGVASTASADTYTDRSAFEGDFPGLFNLDFEGYAPDGSFLQPAPDFSPLGAAFSDSSNDGVDDTAIADSGFFFGTPTDAFFINEFDASAIIDFNPLVQAAGLDIAIGFGGGTATVDVFDAAGGLLASESFDTEAEQVFTTFIGFGNLGDIASIVVTPAPGGFVLLDNVTYGIPAPASLALLGLAGVVSRRRR